MRKVISLIEDSRHKKFPGVIITKQRKVRKLFGEQE